ncbi:YjgH family protein [Aspergillus clavatus NRRL 1]|uniref:L-PSP family endoribonuclease, putative n=1 Tax=Aspergillus clavatus (strain ATCC 1007 / CBS 513.65 / DSM 816 / NCTC 3887 / NRRL 1 / QM 1276 / 107) TaxID=344612 RepID=A1CCJ5_ASPCL|nr:L-PSP family endoribonuclease, putative [Aspergillus clavatus NRRL 1]EAW12252.1 L-PSP family endoribonuclease, putative [Aspergillus clavatus NRRL 1]
MSTTVTTSPNGKKQLYATSSPYEDIIGYYRAVRHGAHIFVAGTTAVDPTSPASAPQLLYPGDAKNQTIVALRESVKAVEALGGTGAASVVRVKMFVARSEDCMAVGEGFREVLGKQQGGGMGAAATMIVVQNGFVNPEMLVEVEVDAIADE